MRRTLPEPGTLAFTPAIVFIACLLERLWLTASMAIYFRDPAWTLLMVLGAIGSAAVLAACAFAVDGASRPLPPTLRFSVRVFGGMFLAGAYLVSYLIGIVFAFHPAVLMLTAPLQLAAAVTGVVLGLLAGGAAQAIDAGWRRMRAA